jgi:hypothetical protein
VCISLALVSIRGEILIKVSVPSCLSWSYRTSESPTSSVVAGGRSKTWLELGTELIVGVGLYFSWSCFSS